MGATANRFFRHVALVALAIGLSLNAGAFAADVVVVVSIKSPVTALRRDQVADIFLGRTRHFPDGEPAVPIDLTEGSDVRDAFYSAIADRTPAQVKANWSRILFTGRGTPPEDVASSVQVRQRLEANPHAIGYLERSQVDRNLRIVTTQ